MTRRIYLFGLFFFIIKIAIAQDKSKTIEITLKGDLERFPDSIPLIYQDVEGAGIDRKTIRAWKKNPVWRIQANEPIFFRFDNLYSLNVPVDLAAWYILDPGDSITISYSGMQVSFSGTGSVKLRLKQALRQVTDSIKKPTLSTKNFTISIEDYLDWHAYLQKKWIGAIPLFDSYKDSVSAPTWLHLKIDFIKSLEGQRHDKFNGLLLQIRKNELRGVSWDKLCKIYDSTFFTSQAMWMRGLPLASVASSEFIGDQARRKWGFSYEISDSYEISESDYLYSYFKSAYDIGKNEYVGRALENYLANLMMQVIKHGDDDEKTARFLAKYYAEPRMSEYKELVKNYQIRLGELTPGKRAPNFTFHDEKGRLHSLRDYLGKLVVLNFLQPAYKAHAEDNAALENLLKMFGGDTSLIIINIVSSRKDISKKAGLSNEFHLFADQLSHPILQLYGEYEKSKVHVIDPQGKIIVSSSSGTISKSSELKLVLESELAAIKYNLWVNTNDSPYLLYEGSNLKSWSISNGRVESLEHGKNRTVIFKCNSDVPGQNFSVKLKSTLVEEHAVHKQPEKLLALSDIEGNFDALRMILQRNKVIDDNFKWIFGKGHLVFAGDMFDRGNQITECLWLIYSLEDQAIAAGGYVHFILGNHEIMNLSGDLRYLQEKYKHNAQLINKDYVRDLYGVHSELGRWLRTKNIVEKIGDFLFVHGGISDAMNNLDLSLDSINSLARPFYDKDAIAKISSNKALSVIFHPDLSPFWYRNYYLRKNLQLIPRGNKLDTVYKAEMGEVASTLSRYKVKYIVTGHTIYKGDNMQGENISVHYNGKVINLNTNHHKGWSEGLLVAGENLFRVNKEGAKFPLTSSKTRNYNMSLH